jgi:hypothetical protein
MLYDTPRQSDGPGQVRLRGPYDPRGETAVSQTKGDQRVIIIHNRRYSDLRRYCSLVFRCGRAWRPRREDRWSANLTKVVIAMRSRDDLPCQRSINEAMRMTGDRKALQQCEHAIMLEYNKHEIFGKKSGPAQGIPAGESSEGGSSSEEVESLCVVNPCRSFAGHGKSVRRRFSDSQKEDSGVPGRNSGNPRRDPGVVPACWNESYPREGRKEQGHAGSSRESDAGATRFLQGSPADLTVWQCLCYGCHGGVFRGHAQSRMAAPGATVAPCP